MSGVKVLAVTGRPLEISAKILSKTAACVSERVIVSKENKFQITCPPASTVLLVGRLVGEC